MLFAAIAVQPGRGIQGDQQSWDPSVDCESFVLYLQTYVALRRLSNNQSLGQDVPTSPDESSGSSGT